MALIAQPFELHVGDSALGDLRDRLARVRFPDEAPVTPWSFGTSVDFMRELVAHWRDHYDWRATESAFNALPQFKTRIEGIDVPEFPREILRPPRVSAERVFNIQRWTVMPKGGHFAALEQPRPLAEEIRAFFRALR